MSEQQKRTIAAATLLLLTMLAIAGGLFRLSRPDAAQTELFLSCTETDHGGWSFETEDGPVEPVFGFGGYLSGVPADGDGPVAAQRVIQDSEQREFLQFICYGMGVEVFLDDELLYSDFPEAERGIDGFLIDADPSGIDYDGLRVPLGADCAGKTLRVVTYTAAYDGLRMPVLPTLTGRLSDAIIQTAASVPPVAAITALALLALALLVFLLFGIQNGHPLWTLLPLAAYFLLTALPLLLNSYLAVAAGVANSRPLLWLGRLSLDALLVFLALSDRGVRRWVLLVSAAVHIVLSALWAFCGDPMVDAADNAGFLLFLLALLLMLLSGKGRFRRSALCIVTVALMLLLSFGITWFWDVPVLYPLVNPVSALLLSRDCRAFFSILSAAAALLCTLQTLWECVGGTLRHQRRIQALRSHDEIMQERYAQSLEAVERTAILRHEWKNHIALLQMLAQKGDLNAMVEHLAQLDDQLDHLSPRNFTANLTVNTILQHFAARAQESGVLFRVTAQLPATLSIDEGDLCSFLFNLLGNALEAAVKKPHGEIECTMQIRQNYLTICCVNSYDGTLSVSENAQLETTKPDKDSHGFGLAQMRSIAKKYGSTLSITYDASAFTVMTALKLPSN